MLYAVITIYPRSSKPFQTLELPSLNPGISWCSVNCTLLLYQGTCFLHLVPFTVQRVHMHKQPVTMYVSDKRELFI
jgi:hypothetical protein